MTGGTTQCALQKPAKISRRQRARFDKIRMDGNFHRSSHIEPELSGCLSISSGHKSRIEHFIPAGGSLSYRPICNRTCRYFVWRLGSTYRLCPMDGYCVVDSLAGWAVDIFVGIFFVGVARICPSRIGSNCLCARIPSLRECHCTLLQTGQSHRPD